MPTQKFPRLPARATFVADTFCVRDTKNVSDIVQKHFVSATIVPSLRSPRNIMGNNVSATMCPRLPGSLLSEGLKSEEGVWCLLSKGKPNLGILLLEVMLCLDAYSYDAWQNSGSVHSRPEEFEKHRFIFSG